MGAQTPDFWVNIGRFFAYLMLFGETAELSYKGVRSL
jgi:hypothetical protein